MKYEVDKETFKALTDLEMRYGTERILCEHSKIFTMGDKWTGMHKCLNDVSLMRMSELLVRGYEENKHIQEIFQNYKEQGKSLEHLVVNVYFSGYFKEYDTELEQLWHDAESSMLKLRKYIDEAYNVSF